MAKYVRADEMATVLAVPVERILVLVSEGMPQVGRDRYDPGEVVPWFVGHMRQSIFENARRLGITIR